MLAEAVREELIERNVASIVRPPSVRQEEVRPWSPEEAAKFLKAARQDRLYALFAVGVGLGLRRGELLGLRWSDVDLEQALIHVRQTAQRINRQGMIFGHRSPQGRSEISRSQQSLPRFSASISLDRRSSVKSRIGRTPASSSHRPSAPPWSRETLLGFWTR
jgi:integrase